MIWLRCPMSTHTLGYQAGRLQVLVAFCDALDPSRVRAMLELQVLVFIAWSHFLLNCLDLPRCEHVAFPNSHSSAQSLLQHCPPYHDSLCGQTLSPAQPSLLQLLAGLLYCPAFCCCTRHTSLGSHAKGSSF